MLTKGELKRWRSALWDRRCQTNDLDEEVFLSLWYGELLDEGKPPLIWRTETISLAEVRKRWPNNDR